MLTLASAQYPLTAFASFADWETHVAVWVAEAVRHGAQLLLFPEYGAMELASLLPDAERSDLRAQVAGLERFRAGFLETFAELAEASQVIIVAPSIPVDLGDRVVNRVYVFGPDGVAGHQDKLFMTRFEDEEWGIQAGPPLLTVFEAVWGAFGIQTCFDVEFPIGAQVLAAHGAGLILAPSCTETIRGCTRVHVGARARALENQCYVAVAQTVGDAPWSPAVDVNYGYAAVYSTPDAGLPEEGIVAALDPQQRAWLVQMLDFDKIRTVRESGQVFNFRNQRQIGYTLRGKEVEVLRRRI
jgi:predicted amidohydrolase